MASIGSNVLSSRKGRYGDDLHLKVVRVSNLNVDGRAASRCSCLVHCFREAIILWGDDYGVAPATCRENEPLMRPKGKDRFIRVDDDDGVVMFLQWSCKFRWTRLANEIEMTINNKKRKIIRRF